MKQSIRSYNSRLIADIQQLLIPSLPRALLDLILAIILLAAINARALWDYFSGITINQPNVVTQVLNGENPQAVYRFIDKITQGRLIQVIFWLFVGCTVYVLVWFIGNLITNIRNDIVADEFIHPAGYNRSSYWGSVIGHKVFLICLLVISVGYIFLILKVSLLLANLCYASITNFTLAHSLAEIGVSIVALALMLQVLFTLGRIVLNAWQVVYKNL